MNESALLPATFDVGESVRSLDSSNDQAQNKIQKSSEGPIISARKGEAWFVCHTKPRCEKKLAALLRAEDMLYYLPLADSVRRYAQHIKRFTKPIFPGYVFVLVELERKARIYQMDLVVRAIPVTDESGFVNQIRQVQRLVSSGYELSVLPLLRKGRHVRVMGGPLHGLEGYVDDPDSPRGVVISVDVLRQGLLVKVPADRLVALP